MKKQFVIIFLCAFMHGIFACYSFPMFNEFLHTPIFFSSSGLRFDQTGSIFIMAPIWVVGAMFSLVLAVLPTSSTAFILGLVRFTQPTLISKFKPIPYFSAMLIFSTISLCAVLLIVQFNPTPFLMSKFPLNELKSLCILTFISGLLTGFMMQWLTRNSTGTPNGAY